MNRVGYFLLLCLAALATILWPLTGSASPDADTELAKEAQNPVAKLISVPFQNNFNFGIGPNHVTQWVLNVQPVIPISLGPDWNLITRTIMPIINQPSPASGIDSAFGLGDINPTFFLSPAGSAEFIWGVGPTFTLPTATDTILGSGKWSVGPAAVALTKQGPWVAGALANTQKIMVSFLSLAGVVFFCAQGWAWMHGNRWGGGMEHSFGSTSRETAWGGSMEHTAGEGTTRTSAWGTSTSHEWGEGTSHTNIYGGSATHYEGGGWSKTSAYGGTAYGDAHYGGAYYHPPGAYYPAYHPPATVNYYGSGCYNCGGWATAGAAAAGLAVGTMAGAAAASANSAAATSVAYSAGVAAGSAAGANYVMGATYGALPGGCVLSPSQGTTYYFCGNAWFQPSYGANGVYYRVVPAP